MADSGIKFKKIVERTNRAGRDNGNKPDEKLLWAQTAYIPELESRVHIHLEEIEKNPENVEMLEDNKGIWAQNYLIEGDAVEADPKLKPEHKFNGINVTVTAINETVKSKEKNKAPVKELSVIPLDDEVDGVIRVHGNDYRFLANYSEHGKPAPYKLRISSSEPITIVNDDAGTMLASGTKFTKVDVPVEGINLRIVMEGFECNIAFDNKKFKLEFK